MKNKIDKSMLTRAAMDVILFFVIVFAMLNVCMYFRIIEKGPAWPDALIITAIWSVWKVIKYFWDCRIQKMESEE